jgi:hypothetical protein
MKRERGAAAVEFSLVFMLLLMIAIGAFEWGMGFRDSLAVSSAAREGARVGSASGTNSSADCLILEASAGALKSVSGNQVAELWIFRSTTSGAIQSGQYQQYRPAQPTDNPATLVCGTWFRMTNSWPAANRINTGSNRDWLGVRIVYDHAWKTGFLWWNGSSRWNETAVMRLEPAI